MADAKKIPGCVFFASDVSEAVAVTDRGREIPLFRYEVAVVLEKGEPFELQSDGGRRDYFRWSEQQFLAMKGVAAAKLERMAEPSLEANCHGWAFAGGRFGIKDEYVSSIITDQGYAAVTEPQDGDLAVYWDANSATHSGIVRRPSSGVLRVQSKWGPFSVFEHFPEAFNYPGAVCAIYRSPRPNHGLTIRTSTIRTTDS
jgi:hypothetical protein